MFFYYVHFDCHRFVWELVNPVDFSEDHYYIRSDSLPPLYFIAQLIMAFHVTKQNTEEIAFALQKKHFVQLRTAARWFRGARRSAQNRFDEKNIQFEFFVLAKVAI